MYGDGDEIMSRGVDEENPQEWETGKIHGDGHNDFTVSLSFSQTPADTARP